MKWKDAIWIILVVVLVLSSIALAQAVKRNDIPGDILLGSKRVMRLAPFPGLTLGERVAAVNQRLATLQGNYPNFDVNRIVVVEATDFGRFVAPASWDRSTLPRSLWESWVALRASRAVEFPFVIGYWRFARESAFVGEEFGEPIYVYTPHPIDKSVVVLKAVIIPIVTVTKNDAALHSMKLYDLAVLWMENLKRAFSAVKR